MNETLLVGIPALSDTVFFARQPIFDSRQHVFGYELLFREGEAQSAGFIDGDLATRSVLLNAYSGNSSPQVLNGKPGFINVTRRMLNALPIFAKNFLIAELLETEHGVTGLIDELREFKQRGFKIALDDFEAQHYSPELIDVVEIVKLDVLDYTQVELAGIVDRLSQHSVKLLAEKVETHEMFLFCQSLGFDYYQGYFFCKPELIRGQILDANRRAMFDLIRELYQSDVDIDVLSEVIKRDVIMSYKLLKLVNSSFYQRAQEVNTVNHAVAILGIDRIRSWATLVSLGQLDQKPQELHTESLIRAYMCEYLGRLTDADLAMDMFCVGMFSCLDAWLDVSLKTLIEALPLSNDIANAVINKEGQKGELLSLALDYIHSNWSAISDERLQSLNVTQPSLCRAYEHGVERADEASRLMVNA